MITKPFSGKPLRVLIIEDEGLIAMELELLLEEAGHRVVGWAASSTEAKALVDNVAADLAFVDINLIDGPTGIAVARHIADRKAAMVVFMTADAQQLPDDFAGAAGVVAKPYSEAGLNAALRYLHEGVRKPPPGAVRPSGLTLSPSYKSSWPD